MLTATPNGHPDIYGVRVANLLMLDLIERAVGDLRSGQTCLGAAGQGSVAL